jgi:hypothetical protein
MYISSGLEWIEILTLGEGGSGMAGIRPVTAEERRAKRQSRENTARYWGIVMLDSVMEDGALF